LAGIPNKNLECLLRIRREDTRKIERLPDEDEIECTIKQLACNKTPGSEGITAEVLRSSWTFMKPKLMLLIKEFWAIGEVYEEFVQGFLKLMPKKLDKRGIIDWQPLKILQITCKFFISKLLANRF
jgi:hypothetical protein